MVETFSLCVNVFVWGFCCVMVLICVCVGAACKTVVVPERVVHALNMKVEEGMIRGYMQQKNRFYGTSNIENG